MANYNKEQQQILIEQFSESCRNAGLKVTHQRTEIFRQLLLNPDHPTAEILYKRLLPTLSTISLDTVYRTLATLEQNGLVARIQTSESQARFEAVLKSHHHIICKNCKQVQDFEWPEVDDIELPLVATEWGRIDTKNIVMYGVCNNCLKS